MQQDMGENDIAPVPAGAGRRREVHPAACAWRRRPAQARRRTFSSTHVMPPRSRSSFSVTDPSCPSSALSRAPEQAAV